MRWKVKNMYENPIERIFGEIQTKIIEQGEDQIMQAVQNCGVSVDKEELIKALNYDRQQYEKGYADAKAEQRWIPCSERLPEEDGEYLCDYNGHVHIGQMINKHFRHYGEIADHLITAWQPLPSPYGNRSTQSRSIKIQSSDLISRQDAIETVNETIAPYIPYLTRKTSGIPLEMALAIKRLPSAQPERKNGKWIDLNFSDEMWGKAFECSICGEMMIGKPNYCFNCGARMDGEADGPIH